MANPSKRQLAERYLIKFSGGMMSDDSKIDERFFIQEINQALAVVAKDSFIENANFDSINFANDQFVSKYNNIAINTEDDGSGLKYSTLPEPPVGMPKGRGLVMVMPPAGIENTLKPISLREVPLLLHQPTIPNRIFYWLEGIRIYYYPAPSFGKVIVRAITSGTADIDEPLNVPQDVLNKVELIVEKSMAKLFQIGPDITNDGEANGR